ncbi:hypothetical protein FS749_004393 [Ceratobasidium sp. UAMH 11750]|nr:hypothetical protein FS749_004393 [Ceratobasidium sp. UAMH 11750]
MSSLLEPGHAKHGRKASVTLYTSTVPDEKQSTLSPTPTGTTAAATLISDKKKSKKAGDESEGAALSHTDPSQDQTDLTPFEQKPLVLASLVDPKSLPSLEAIGGCEGLLRGLGTDTNLGLRSWQYTDSGQRNNPEGGNGGGAVFFQHLSENEGRQNVDRVLEDHDVGSECNKSHKDNFPLEMSKLNSVVQDPLRSMFNEAIAVNSTAFEDKNPETGELEFVGSKTKTALLCFAQDLKWAPYQ